MAKLFYIGGYGHSGTTLLEYLMTSSPAVLACGEVASVIRERDGERKDKRCSCGRAKAECPVWSLFQLANELHPPTHAELLDRIIEKLGSQYDAIVDSSKTAWGMYSAPFCLRRRFGPKFVLVHLTRHPTAACWSVLRKDYRKANKKAGIGYYAFFQCGWTALAWSLANLSCELFGIFYPTHYVRIRYEDLVRSPTQVLNGIFERFLPGIHWNFVELDGRKNRHQLYGNSVRYHKLSLEDVKEDLKWRSEMPPECARIVLALSYLLRWRYGYSR